METIDPVLERTSWPVAGLLLDALTRRDFDALLDCLDPGVRFRALVPPGAFELTTATETVARFRRWFDGPDAFEVVDASVGRIGAKTYLRWQLRLEPADGPARIVEQHAYTTGAERIETLDLLCSGFHLETGAER
ncbi:MAG TPA: hypothetical protein VGN18_02515 [Jatrophihabitans sp.]|jgi:hypothetical protein|uniref:hypothetical protein n=1 Tax=Jatrophihabitans sp. TaxID=1932789 RepID=UPI002E0056A3|nr:hypothetical protein [Jatrophihabitans sp.]